MPNHDFMVAQPLREVVRRVAENRRMISDLGEKTGECMIV